ncbi:NADP-dependent malic enzyme isoform X2 [Eupeodes corollae]|uniref:NADP-dependent malic enzyme isoform X2 n=1 Tax=Eupeodes corollae TaxID=290404 RepID=UPI0024930BD3|nr:NADP-dependent malic enzyme isoform X2 [Eupeodes corollae]
MMGNSSSMCRDKKSVHHRGHDGEQVFPSANGSHNHHSANSNWDHERDRHHRRSQHIPHQLNQHHLYTNATAANGNGIGNENVKMNSNSQSISNPNSNPQQQQLQHYEHQIYKTTIPVNNHQCQIQNCSNNIQMNQSAVCGMTTGIGLTTNDVTNGGIPSHSHCCCHNHNNNNDTNCHLVRNSATTTPQLDGKRFVCPTTNTITQPHHENHTTLVGYGNGCGGNGNGNVNSNCGGGELTDGVAKLCQFSSNRNTQQTTSSSHSYSPALVDATRTTNNNNNSNFYFQNSHRAYSSYIDKLRGVSTSAISDENIKPSSKMASSGHNRDRLGMWGTSGDNEVAGKLSGLDRMQKKRYNKGLGFTLEERQLMGIQGLLPAVVKTLEEQVQHAIILLDRLENDLDKYIYLNGLADRNERLFYNVLAADIGKMMPIVYTPVVGLGCQKFSLVFQNPKGMYITIKDKGHVYNVLKNWPETDVRAIVVTDGERILGLGDLGANGMGIPCGKLSLYTALAGIPPHQCLPITLDVGTNTQSILDDPLYIGLRQKRVTGAEYDEFLEEFMQAVMRRFGQNCLVQFEDFGNANAFRLLSRYRDTNCVFNDDIQGTASVALAGLLASLKIKNTCLKENTILFQGAGEAALGIANLCVMAMQQEGLSKEEAKKHVWLVDSKGLIVKNRPSGGLSEHKLHFAHEHEPVDTLAEAVDIIKPSILIGAAAIGGAFTPAILEKMAEFNDTPIIFALSNPTVKAECTAIQAYTHTKGKCIFASGSPFDPVEYNGRTFYPGQGNNSYIFPGVALGVICAGMLTIPEEVFLMSAEKLAEICSDEDLAKGSLYPPLSAITKCSIQIAVKIMEYAYKNGLATVRPEPEDKEAFIKSQMYELNYSSAVPEVYQWSNKL